MSTSDGRLRVVAACFFACALLALAGAGIQLSVLLSLHVDAPSKAALLATNVPTWLVALGFTGAGLGLLQKKGYLFCLVMAVIACAFVIPVGIYGLVVLLRPEVKAAFAPG